MKKDDDDVAVFAKQILKTRKGKILRSKDSARARIGRLIERF